MLNLLILITMQYFDNKLMQVYWLN